MSPMPWNVQKIECQQFSPRVRSYGYVRVCRAIAKFKRYFIGMLSKESRLSIN